MDIPPPLPSSAFDHLIEQALAEDLGSGDITTKGLFQKPMPALARIIGHDDLVVAGLWLAPEILNRLDPAIQTDCWVNEGQSIRAGTTLAQFKGEGRALLMGERVALNFLQRLCGIATLTARFVEAVRGYPVRIRDTRKTTPGWRLLEKYAVRTAGGSNHRMDLHDAILIKDNHIAIIGSLEAAVKKIKQSVSPSQGIEVEVKTLDEVETALKTLDLNEKDTLLLDNMPIAEIKRAVDLIRHRIRVEASGGVTLSTVRETAACGVDFISVGALTHSAPAVDISMDVVPIG